MWLVGGGWVVTWLVDVWGWLGSNVGNGVRCRAAWVHACSMSRNNQVGEEGEYDE